MYYYKTNTLETTTKDKNRTLPHMSEVSLSVLLVLTQISCSNKNNHSPDLYSNLWFLI